MRVWGLDTVRDLLEAFESGGRGFEPLRARRACCPHADGNVTAPDP